VEWIREGEILPPGDSGEPDSLRAMRPWVLEVQGALRMWYSGNDGTTWRILEAVQRIGGEWERLGVAIDAGFAGNSDQYGVESPCVVNTPGGYLMAYAGFDGDATRLHMATSLDGQQWVPQGTIMQRGREDAIGASHPWLVMTGDRWWLFFSGYDRSGNGRRPLSSPRFSIWCIVGPGRDSPRTRERRGRNLPSVRARDFPDLLHVLRKRGRTAGQHRLGNLSRRGHMGPSRDYAGPIGGGSRWAQCACPVCAQGQRGIASHVVLGAPFR
jgi:hypothetical protein